MRAFGPKADQNLETAIRQQALELYNQVPTKRDVKGEAFAMDDAERVVLHEVDIRLPEGGRLRLAVTEDAARPPFEWLIEITSDIGESEYFKHYLVREDDIMLAQRKELTPIDNEEAKLILHDLDLARKSLTSV